MVYISLIALNETMMFVKLNLIAMLVLTVLALACSQHKTGTKMPPKSTFSVVKTEEEWKKVLSPAAYRVLRQKGTERPFSGAHWDNHEEGVYACAACRQLLFSSETKFESGTGWPSFYEPASDEAVAVVSDTSAGMVRDEVVCANCGGHLGHVFSDGPEPTGLRYCMNSVSLNFIKKE
jgi:peptide-methionine (R)-S-oxide reductase